MRLGIATRVESDVFQSQAGDMQPPQAHGQLTGILTRRLQLTGQVQIPQAAIRPAQPGGLQAQCQLGSLGIAGQRHLSHQGPIHAGTQAP